MSSKSLSLKPFQCQFNLPRRARLEIVPLIDVMFLLVSFFVVVSISMVQQKGIHIDLAASNSAEESKPQEEDLILSIDAKGILYLNKERLSAAELKQALEEHALASKDKQLFLNADESVQHKVVVKTLDTIRKAGLYHIVLSVEPTP